MSLAFATIPSKRLAQGITSASTSFYVNNIISFNTTDALEVESTDLGTQHYVVFRNDTGTKIEIFEIDPATIGTGPITIVRRGLSYYGDRTTEITANKLDWSANETIVNFGTDAPQLFQYLKEYIDAASIAGAVPASTTTPGISERATQAEVDARTATQGSYDLFVRTDTLRATKYHDYIADAGASDAYAITVVPAITAYSAGQVFTFKANTVNTGACTLNVCALGAKSIVKNYNLPLVDGDIKANQLVMVQYDGTNMQMLSPSGNLGELSALTAGETITGATTPQACFILSEQRINRFALVSNLSAAEEDNFEIYDNATNDNRIGHRFSSGSFDSITGFVFVGSAQGNIDSDSYACYLYAVDGSGNPTGAALGTKAFTKASAHKSSSEAGQSHWYIQFDSPITVSQSTTYILVIAETTQGGDTTNNIVLSVNSGPAAANISRYSTNGGSSWSAGYPGQAGGGFARAIVYGSLSTAINGGTVGRVYLSDGNDPDRNYFDGFVYSTTSAGNSVNLLSGTDIPHFSGLLPGTSYYLDTTPGAITTTKAKGRKIGTARTATSMGLSDRVERSDQYNDGSGSEYDFVYGSTSGGFNGNAFVYASSTTVNQIFVYAAKLYHQACYGLFTKRVRSSQEITGEKKDIAFMVNQGEYVRNGTNEVTFSNYSIWYDL